MYRRLSTDSQKVKAKVHVISLQAQVNKNAAFMIQLKRNNHIQHTGAKYPTNGVVIFDEFLTVDITLYSMKKSGDFQAKTCDLLVDDPTCFFLLHSTNLTPISCDLRCTAIHPKKPEQEICMEKFSLISHNRFRKFNPSCFC